MREGHNQEVRIGGGVTSEVLHAFLAWLYGVQVSCALGGAAGLGVGRQGGVGRDGRALGKLSPGPARLSCMAAPCAGEVSAEGGLELGGCGLGLGSGLGLRCITGCVTSKVLQTFPT